MCENVCVRVCLLLYLLLYLLLFWLTVVKEAAALNKHNLFVDSTELQCVSQISLSEIRTPPQTSQSSLSRASGSTGFEHGVSDNPETDQKQEASESPAVPDVTSSVPVCLSAVASVDKHDAVSSSDQQGEFAEADKTPNDAGTALITFPTIIISEPVSPEENLGPPEDRMEPDVHGNICEVELASSLSEAPPPPSPPPVSNTSADSSNEATEELPASPDPPLEGDICPALRNGQAYPSDPAGPLDCVKAIRDLVVEVIEVEDVVSPRPDDTDTQ